MHEIGLLFAFGVLVIRFVYWVYSVWEGANPGKKVFVGQIDELFLLLFLFTQIAGLRVLPMPSSLGNFFVGLLFTCGGVALSFAGKKQMGKQWHYAGSDISPKKLIATGIYRYIRHPIYTGYVISFIGIELMLASYLWISFLGLFIPLFLQAKREENLLEKRFGKKFGLYKKSTKFFLPYLL